MAYNIEEIWTLHSDNDRCVHLVPFPKGTTDQSGQQEVYMSPVQYKRFISEEGFVDGLEQREDGDIIIFYGHCGMGAKYLQSHSGSDKKREDARKITPEILSRSLRARLSKNCHIIFKACNSGAFAKEFTQLMQEHEYPPLSVWYCDETVHHPWDLSKELEEVIL